jgi:FkbM family methyltransferase
MRPTGLDLLGAAASRARLLGMTRALRAAATAGDAVSMRLGSPPLGATITGVTIRGYLRHRSFLAEALTPAATYRDLFCRLIVSGMTIVDGGAHIGLYTVLAAAETGPTGLVIAVEPDRYNLAALRHNVGRLGNGNVRIVSKALAAGPGTTPFYEARSTIGSSTVPRRDAQLRDVETTSVDAELAAHDVGALLVKLNIEGAELLALTGMRETLARAAGPVMILVEVNPPLLAAAGTSGEEVVSWLEDAGFVVRQVDLPLQQTIPLERPLAKCHLLATRRATSPSGRTR